MKLFGKTKDGVIDNLLRAYVSRRADTGQVCPEFDPDLANAYIERSLAPASWSRYEKHLSDCAACRKNVVALVRLVEADTLPTASGSQGRARARLFDVKQVFGAMTGPRWALAAAAVIVLAISVPLLLSRDEGRFSKQASKAVTELESGEKAQSASEAREASPADRFKSAAASSTSAPTVSRQRDKRQSGAVAVNAPVAAQASTASAANRATPEQSQKLEAKSAPQSRDDAQRKSEGQSASQVATQAGAAPESQVAKGDSDKGRQQQQEKDSAQPSEPKARADELRTENEKAPTEGANARPAPRSASEATKARRGLKQSAAKLALRDSATGESARPPERRIGSKKFSWKQDTWIDKDFDADKDLPVVTIIRDSNVYKEVLSKRAGLKPYLTAFETERAIIVYKGTVYKLIPQHSEK